MAKLKEGAKIRMPDGTKATVEAFVEMVKIRKADKQLVQIRMDGISPPKKKSSKTWVYKPARRGRPKADSKESVSEPEGRKEPMEQVMRGVEQGEHPIALDAIGTDEKEVDAAGGYGHESIGQPLPIVLDELHELEASADECEAFLPATT